MRARERERFLRMNFTEDELKIRNELYKARKNAKYKMIITTEHYNKQRKYDDRKPPYDDYLAYFSDYPDEGKYLDTIYFRYPYDYMDIIKLYEGQFYQLFNLDTGKEIGSGCLDPDSPVEEIRYDKDDPEYFECCCACAECFWRGMLYDETKEVFDGVHYCCTCYHPEERKVWEEEFKKDLARNNMSN